ITATGLAIALLIIAIYLNIRSDFRTLAVLTAAGVVALNLGSLDPVIARARDRDSSGSFGDELAAAKPVGAIGTLGCGERELGMSYFYLGRTVQDISRLSLEERVGFIEAPDTAGVLIGQRGRHGELKTADQLISHDFGPNAPALHVALQDLVGG